MATFIPHVTRLSPRVIMVLGCNPGPMTLQGTNTYLVGTGKRRILLDTGDEGVPQYISNLSNVLQEEACYIDQIVVSHWHHDHIGGVPDVLKVTKSNCTIWKHEQTDDKGNVVPSHIQFKSLKHNQVLHTEGASLRVIHTPGHTTDHIVLTLEEEAGVLFSGDTILGESTAVFEDLHDYMKSLHLIKDARPKVIYPGHGPVIKDPSKVIEYYIAHRQSRENQIINVLQSSKLPLTPMEIVKAIYTDIDESLLIAAENNVKKHLLKLLKENKVFQVDSKWQSTFQNCTVAKRAELSTSNEHGWTPNEPEEGLAQAGTPFTPRRVNRKRFLLKKHASYLSYLGSRAVIDKLNGWKCNKRKYRCVYTVTQGVF